MPAVKNVGEPCAGEPHARFDVAAGGNQVPVGPARAARNRAPPADPTIRGSAVSRRPPFQRSSLAAVSPPTIVIQTWATNSGTVFEFVASPKHEVEVESERDSCRAVVCATDWCGLGLQDRREDVGTRDDRRRDGRGVRPTQPNEYACDQRTDAVRYDIHRACQPLGHNPYDVRRHYDRRSATHLRPVDPCRVHPAPIPNEASTERGDRRARSRARWRVMAATHTLSLSRAEE